MLQLLCFLELEAEIETRIKLDSETFKSGEFSRKSYVQKYPLEWIEIDLKIFCGKFWFSGSRRGLSFRDEIDTRMTHFSPTNKKVGVIYRGI